MGPPIHRIRAVVIIRYVVSGLVVTWLSLLASPLTANDFSNFSVSSTVSEQIDDPIPDSQPISEEGEPLDSFPGTEQLEKMPPVREVVFPTPVTTVARQPSTVGRSPAAVFVIDQEMIRRSGARSIPELLRMVPGLHVARVDASKWSISSRGFSGRIARKLLVQIDGRSVYTPMFGGTFWDVQDVLLSDIERIEVIRGPGATVWGANAVNGVINVITKNARDTHGIYAEGGGGTEERSFAGARVGDVAGNGVHWRVSSKWFDRDRQFEPSGRELDDWRQGRVGFRADWDPNRSDTYTFQGDVYTGTNGNAAHKPPIGYRNEDEPVSGANLLGRWTRTFDERSDMSLQVYYDRTDRRMFFFDQDINTLDIDFQHRFPWNGCHNVIWGLGYRRIWDSLATFGSPAQFAVDPVSRISDLPSAFIQDEITLIDDSLYFTIGTKLSDNLFTDFEVQPTARLLWLPDERSAAWGAVSRAVRTPSRIEHDGRVLIGELPPVGSGIPLTLLGQGNMDSEELIAYEIGYRRQPAEWFSWDLALFYNVYDDLIAFRPTTPPTFPPTFEIFSGDRGQAYGLEITTDVDMTSFWKVSAWYSLLRMQIETDPSSVVGGEVTEQASPMNQAFLMSSWDVGRDVQFDLMARYVDVLPSVNVPHYLSLDARLAWRPCRHLEISVVGQDLLDSHHPEYGSSLFSGEISTEAQRSVYGMLTWEH